MSDAPATPDFVPALKRYKLTIAYDGTLFHGWQKQEPQHGEPLRTVQAVVESTVAKVTAQPVTLVGASRTDAGVHARGQVAHFDAATRIPTNRLPHAINSRLPVDVEIVAAEEVSPAFDAISGAVRKRYRYRMFNSSSRPLLRRLGVWHCWMNLDIDRMNAAATRLIGTHDIAGFAAAGHGRATTVRTIFDCRVERHDPVNPWDEKGVGPEVHVVIEGDGFLYNTVRIVAGTLVEVGRGHFEPQVIDQIIAAGKRELAGPTLPPEGLCLEWIRYEGERSEK